MSEKELTLKINRLTLWRILTGVFALLFIISLFTGGFGTGSGKVTGGTGSVPSIPTQPSPSPTIPTGIATVNAEKWVDDDPFLGDENAPITMIEFGDFQCPFCKRFRDQTLDQIKRQYIDTGKVKFVYRDFPLSSIHPEAQGSAEASECADDQGKFWEFHDKIYENQQLMSTSSYKQWAADLGLDTNEFNDCLDSGKHTQEVLNDLSDAQASGGRGTPYFLIGNTPVSGAQPFSVFQAAIDAELNK